MSGWVTYVTDNLQVVSKEVERPYPDRIRTSCPTGSKYVIRWSTKARQWEVYDIRRYISGPSTGQFYKAPPPSVRAPSREAAIGYALLMP